MNISRPTLFTIPFSEPFAMRLAERVLARFGAEQEMLSRALILLPSRRACRALKEAFLEASGGKPLLLPRIQPIGDVDEEAVFFAGDGYGALLEKPAPPLGRQMLMAALVQRQSQYEEMTQRHFDQSFWLAGELLRLMDEMEREQVRWDALGEIVHADYAQHWQVTLDFLALLHEHWPQIEQEHQLQSPVKLRNELIAALAENWQKRPPDFHVIAAGTTGSIPATAELLRVISRLPKGEVVLQGVDTLMDEEDWQLLPSSHPQFGFAQLLSRMSAGRKDIQCWMKVEADRDRLLAQWMIPAEKTAHWHAAGKIAPVMLKDIHVMEADNAQEEAAVITTLLREILESEGKTAALVTPDRELARRVSAFMDRFSIQLNDSAGKPLIQTAAGSFLHLLMDVVSSEMDFISVLSLLKHPLFRMGRAEKTCRDMARHFEMDHLRGKFHSSWQSALAEIAAQATLETKIFFDEFSAQLVKLAALQNKQQEMDIAVLWNACVAAAESLSASEDGETLWDAEGGETLWQLSLDIRDAIESAPSPQRLQIPASMGLIVSQLLSETVHRPRYGTHPRLHILSPMEARLMYFDRVILGGLNEDSWPEASRADPWLSRPMREAAGLPLPERRIGHSAHDFCQQFASGEVFMTRAKKQGGVQTVASRWVIRLKAMIDAGGIKNASIFAMQHKYQYWAGKLSEPKELVELRPPMPAPPLASRPRRLSVTQVDDWYENPYKIYAKRILNLREMDDIVQEPDARIMGNVIHKILEDFSRKFPDTLPDNVAGELENIAQQHLDAVLKDSASAIFWHSRFHQIARWLEEQEKTHRKPGDKVHPEIKGGWTFAAPAGEFMLSAKADRIDVHADGTATIIDYKTGEVPSDKDIVSAAKSQLPLEALILENGKFGSLSGIKTASLQYWKLKGQGKAEVKSVKDMEQAVQTAKERLQHEVARYDNADVPYPSRNYIKESRRDDVFDHLARIKEWAE